MRHLSAAALLAVLLALAPFARAAVDDAGCAASLGKAILGECAGSGFAEDFPKNKYFCPYEDCQKTLLRVASVCLAEGYRLADQVLAVVKANPNNAQYLTAVTADTM